jgi:hypothetical protein
VTATAAAAVAATPAAAAATAACGPVTTSPGPVGEELVGRCINVWSELDTAWFEALVEVRLRVGWGTSTQWLVLGLYYLY